jgi:hypothetical protein
MSDSPKMGGGDSSGPKLGRSAPSLKSRVNDHEAEIAEALGGRRQPNSGATAAHKGDVKLRHFLLDSKETDAATMILQGKDLTKITREADGERLKPGLVITIRQVPDTVAKEWVLIPLEVFSAMLKAGQDKGLSDVVGD